MSSGRRNSVARPAQYTESRVDTPTAPRASANRMVVPTGTSTPAPRSTRAKPTAIRSTSTSLPMSVPVPVSGTALRCGPDQLLDARGLGALLVFAVLEDGAEGDLDRALVDGRATERGECVGPVDRLRDARRLVELE